MEAIFKICSGEGEVAAELQARGLSGLWQTVVQDMQPGQDRRVEWKLRGYSASAVRFARQTNASGGRIYFFDVLVMTGTGESEQMQQWHASAISALSRAASLGAAAFRKEINRLVGHADGAAAAGRAA